MAWRNTRLESEGAEFLVLGTLLVEGIPAYKTYTNHPGYDVIAINPEKGKTCRIQVKSRWATDYDKGFLIKKFECDFVAFVALNRGYTKKRKLRDPNDTGKISPQIYVFPKNVVKAAIYDKSSWGKCRLSLIKDPDSYMDDWDPVKKYLGIEEVVA